MHCTMAPKDLLSDRKTARNAIRPPRASHHRRVFPAWLGTRSPAASGLVELTDVVELEVVILCERLDQHPDQRALFSFGQR